MFTAARIGFTAAQNPSSNRTRKYHLDELVARLDRKRASPLGLSAEAGGGADAAVAQVLEKVLKGSRVVQSV